MLHGEPGQLGIHRPCAGDDLPDQPDQRQRDQPPGRSQLPARHRQPGHHDRNQQPIGPRNRPRETEQKLPGVRGSGDPPLGDGRVAELQQRQPQHRAKQPGENGPPQLFAWCTCRLRLGLHRQDGRASQSSWPYKCSFNSPTSRARASWTFVCSQRWSCSMIWRFSIAALRRNPLRHEPRPSHLRKHQ